MSLITQCPACATMFRVVPDQLRISEGWVRCGQCDEVFDANAHLQTPATTHATPAPVADTPNTWEQSDPLAPIAQQVDEPEEVAYDWGEIDTGTSASAPISAPATEPEQDAPIPAWQPNEEPTVDAPMASSEASDGLDDVPAEDAFLAQNPHDLSVAEEAMADQYAAAPMPSISAAAAALSAHELPLSFMPPAPKQGHWARWLGTTFWAATAAMMALLLALQIVVHERDRLAVAYPATEPMLLAGCEALGCTVAAPRHIESIAIDSSSFNSVKPGVFLLNVTLKNAGSWRLEMPALELTLTDRQDQVVLRRVLRAVDYAGGTAVIGAGSERSVRMPVQVQNGIAVEQIAGYKLLAFYP